LGKHWFVHTQLIELIILSSKWLDVGTWGVGTHSDMTHMTTPVAKFATAAGSINAVDAKGEIFTWADSSRSVDECGNFALSVS
jgi:hypothetical protein